MLIIIVIKRRMAKMNQFKKELETKKEEYLEVHHDFCVRRCKGNLSKLCNLKDKFDETFDHFFDNVREKYQEEEWLSNIELEEKLNEEDLIDLIEFYTQYIVYLKNDDINSQESFFMI
jgi:thymidylate kinase